MKDAIDNKVIEEYGNAAKKILKIIYDEKNQELLKNEAKAFSETYDIIMNIDYHTRKNIPNSFMEILLKKRDRNIKVDIDYDKNILDQITDETKLILYRFVDSDIIDRMYPRGRVRSEPCKRQLHIECCHREWRASSFTNYGG